MRTIDRVEDSNGGVYSYRRQFPHVQRIKDIINGKIDFFIEFIERIKRNSNRDNDIFLDILDRNEKIMDDVDIFFNIINNIIYFFDKSSFLVFDDYYDEIKNSIKTINIICNGFEYEDNKVEYNGEMFKSIIREMENIKVEIEKLYIKFNRELQAHGLDTMKVIKSKEEIMKDVEDNIRFNEEKKKRLRESYVNRAKKAWETKRKKKALLEESMNSNKEDNDNE